MPTCATRMNIVRRKVRRDRSSSKFVTKRSSNSTTGYGPIFSSENYERSRNMMTGRHPQWRDLDLSIFLNEAAVLVIDPTNSVLHGEGAQAGDGLWRRARAEGGSLEKILQLVALARTHD